MRNFFKNSDPSFCQTRKQVWHLKLKCVSATPMSQPCKTEENIPLSCKLFWKGCISETNVSWPLTHRFKLLASVVMEFPAVEIYKQLAHTFWHQHFKAHHFKQLKKIKYCIKDCFERKAAQVRKLVHVFGLKYSVKPLTLNSKRWLPKRMCACGNQGTNQYVDNTSNTTGRHKDHVFNTYQVNKTFNALYLGRAL